MRLSEAEYNRERRALMILRIIRDESDLHCPPATTFAGTEKVCSGTLTPNTAKAERLRIQKFW